jgi:CheY-like chemotaxis protein
VLTQVVGTRICLRIRLARRLWPVAVHSTQIERVLLNLVINARDAMPEGGTVVITTENQRAAGEAGDGSVVVAVRDTGVGMPPRVRAQVFEPFYTTKPGGTGIGLTTVRAIASIAGGGVDIDTVAGKGTAVSVSLPRTHHIPRACANDRVHAHQFTRVQHRGGRATRILLVDDEASVRDLLRDYLESRGFEVTVAGTGAEALETVQGGACPDLLVTDVHLPDTLGPEVARRLREHAPSMPVVFMSGAPEAATAVAGASDVPMLTKPFSMTELDRAVRTALGTAT